MNFNNEQFKALEPFEPFFTTAVKSQWSRHPGHAALLTIHSTYSQATNTRTPLNGSCQACVLRLLQEVGKLYFADKEEIIAKANDKKAVEVTQEDIKSVRVAVKTRKKSKK